MTNGYDYIIVGAGTAGCTLANRLTEDGNANVLLLEAGGTDWHPYISIPLGMGRMHDSAMFDWGYETEPEPNLNGRKIEAMRGKVLGGSSSINVMAYTRGNRGDYDRWAQKGALGWSYADVLPYFRRAETWENGDNTYRGSEGWSAPSSPRRRIRFLTPGSKPRRPQVIRSPRTTTANSRKDSVAASTPSATDDVRRRPVPICGPRRSGRTSRSRPTRMRRACS